MKKPSVRLRTAELRASLELHGLIISWQVGSSPELQSGVKKKQWRLGWGFEQEWQLG